MSRQRMIHPEIFVSEDFMALSLGARLLFIGMFTTADDHGRGRGSGKILAASIFPGEKVPIHDWAQELAGRKMARFYADAETGAIYYDLPAWKRWQKPKYVAESKFPAFKGCTPLDPVPPGTRPESGAETRRDETRGDERRESHAPVATPPTHDAPRASGAAADPVLKGLNGNGHGPAPLKSRPKGHPMPGPMGALLRCFDEHHRAALGQPYCAHHARDQTVLKKPLDVYGEVTMRNLCRAYWQEIKQAQNETDPKKRSYIGRSRPDIPGFVGQIPNLLREYDLTETAP